MSKSIYRSLVLYPISINSFDLSGTLPATVIVPPGGVFVANDSDHTIITLLSNGTIAQGDADVDATDIPLGLPTLDISGHLRDSELPSDVFSQTLSDILDNGNKITVGQSIQADDSVQLIIGGAAISTDVLPGIVTIQAQSAYSQATVNTSGADTVIGTGLGRRSIKILDYTQLSGKHIYLVVNGVLTTLTEGVDWNADSNNLATAVFLAAAISGVPGLSAVAPGDEVYITGAPGTYSIFGATDDYYADGLILSFDVDATYDGISDHAGYLGPAYDGKALVAGFGGLTRVETAPGGWVASLGSGVLRLSPGISDAAANTISEGSGTQAGVQLWPSNDTFTEASYEAASFLFEYNEVQLVSEALGAGRTVKPLRIGTTQGFNGASNSGAHITFITAGTDALTIDTSQQVILSSGNTYLYDYNLGLAVAPKDGSAYNYIVCAGEGITAARAGPSKYVALQWAADLSFAELGVSILGDTGGIGTIDAHTFIIGTNNTAAITIDTSQIATFAHAPVAPGFSLTGGITWTSGNGSPEGAITAPIGSLYSNTAGGANTTLYVKTSGSGNTGWTAK